VDQRSGWHSRAWKRALSRRPGTGPHWVLRLVTLTVVVALTVGVLGSVLSVAP